MKTLLAVCLFAIAIPAMPQSVNNDFAYVDHHALTVESGNLRELSQKLTRGYVSEKEKTRAIFRWITANISYRTSFNAGKKGDDIYAGNDEDTSALKPLDERVAESVLRTRLALCDGYSRLFKVLCEFSGIRSEVVIGYARTQTFKRIQRFRSNHSWNAVYCDSAWYLLDVTWASGFIDAGTDRYVQHFDGQYFLTKPADFIREHYPDELQWTLMENPPLMPEFVHSPYKQRAFVKYHITSYLPSTGMIQAAVGDTLRFELNSSDWNADKNVSPNPFLDQSVYYSENSALVRPQAVKNNITTYRYVLHSASTKWLYLLYNDDVILRYSINVLPAKRISLLAAME
ncbi:MAG: transglutaminase domain-containing protein [Chitinophagaceae bacterium]